MHIKRIMCAIDFSDASREALHFSAALALKFDAQVTLFHVYQLPGYSLPEGGAVLPSAETLGKLFERIDAKLAEWRADATARGATCDTASAQGAPWHEIVNRAKDGDYHLIVVGSHGHTGLTHILLGSTAERVVRHAPCPVLTVRTADHRLVAEDDAAAEKAET